MELNWQNAGGKLPEGWTVVPLRDFLVNEKSVSVGVMYPGKHDENGVPLIKVGDVKNGKVEGTPESRISLAVDEEYKRTRLSGDELLITLVGNPGECVIVQPHMKGWNAARALAVLRLKDPDTRRWLNMVLQSRPLKHIIDSRLNTTVQKTLNLKDVKELPIPIPNNGTDTLCRYYYDLDQKITLNHQINQTLEQMAQTLFNSWFVDFDPVIDNALDAGNPIPDELQHRAEVRKAVRESEGFKPLPDDVRQLFPDAFEESELGWVPKGWEVSTAGDEFTVKGGSTPSTKNAEFWEGGDIHWTSPKDLSGKTDKIMLDTERKITAEGLKKITSGLLPEKTVLMSSRAPIGYLALAKIPVAVNQGYIAIPSTTRLSQEYALYWLASSVDEIKGIAGGTTFAEISKKTFKSIQMIVPNKETIQMFSKLTSDYLDKISSNAKEVTTLTKLRDTLLPKLISGDLRLDDVEAFVEQETVSA